MTPSTQDARATGLVEALQQISRLRPAGDVNTCKNPRKLVEQMEIIALRALAASTKDQPHDA